MHRRYLAALLVFSGFCGLAYELIWVRMLSLSFGSTTLSFSTVIAVFLGGLALGSWLCGRSPRALAQPVRTYALLEIATGVVGLLLYPVLGALPEVFSYFDPGTGLAGMLARVGVSIAVLLPPTLLMGATLPVACAACVHDDARLGEGTAILYGLNTVGACLGTYGVTFVLFPWLGLDGAVGVVVALNVFVGVVTLIGDRRGWDVARVSPTAPAEPAPDAAAPEAAESVAPVATALACAGGFAAVGTQVVWSRIFSSYLEGSVYGIGAVLVAVLVGIGAGSIWVSTRLVDARRAARAFALTQMALVLSLVALWTALPTIQYLIGTLGGGLKGWSLVHAQLAVVVVALGIPSAMSGVGIPVLVRVVEQHAAGVPRVLSRLYAANTLGSVLGSLITGFVLMRTFGTPATAYLMTILVVIIAVVGSVRLARQWGARRYAPALVASVALLGFPEIDVLRVVSPVSSVQSYWGHGSVVESRRKAVRFLAEGDVATVAVMSDETSSSLTLNGLGQGSWSVTAPRHLLESLLVAQVPLLHHANPSSAMVIGLGAGSTVNALVELGVPRIDVLELEPAVLEGIKHVFGGPGPLASPQVKVIIDDARHHLLINRRGAHRFDVITSMPAHPWVAANIFTREFFELARSNLSDDGVFSTWFGRARMSDELFASLYTAFASVFPHHIVYDLPEVSALFFVGSVRPLALDPARFAALGKVRAIDEQDVPVRDIAYFTTRVTATSMGDAVPQSGPVNTDASMFAELRGPLAGTSTKSFDAEFGARAGLDARVFPEATRTEIVVRTVEALLGTAHGVPRFDDRPGNTARARLVAQKNSALISAEASRYIEARLGAIAGAPGQIEALVELARAAGPYATRAAAFAVALDRDPARRAANLAALIAEGRGAGDLWIRATGSAAQAAATALAEKSTADDALAWLVSAAHGAEPPPAPPSAAQLERLAALLGTANQKEALTTCKAAASRSGQTALLELCTTGDDVRASAESRRVFARGVDASRQARYGEAVELFRAAHATKALDARGLLLFLSTLVRAGDLAGADQLRPELILRGVPAGVVDAWVAQAQEPSAP